MVVQNQVFQESKILNLFLALYEISVKAASQGKPITDVWFSHIPGRDVLETLDFTFPSSDKPTFHFESLHVVNDGVNTLAEFIQAAGCISQLKKGGYNVSIWDWENFARQTTSPSCDYYTDYETSYMPQKNLYKEFMSQINGLGTLCGN